ncbi:hypothetical protein GCM10029964_082740 [Kibdelosporangium lantanae]
MPARGEQDRGVGIGTFRQRFQAQPAQRPVVQVEHLLAGDQQVLRRDPPAVLVVDEGPVRAEPHVPGQRPERHPLGHPVLPQRGSQRAYGGQFDLGHIHNLVRPAHIVERT